MNGEILTGFLLAAWLYLNWRQGISSIIQSAGQRGQQVQSNQISLSMNLFPFIVSCILDIPPAVLIWGVFRGFEGSLLAILIALGMWGGTTLLVLRSSNELNARGLIKQVLIGISDGWLLFSVVAAWEGWFSILVPSTTLVV